MVPKIRCGKPRRSDVPIPVAGGGVQEAAGGGDGVFVHHFAGEAVAEVFRHEQKGLGLFQLLRMAELQGLKLVNRVEENELHAGAGIEILGGNVFLHLPVHSVRPVIPVTDRVADFLFVLVEEEVVDAPGVDAETVGAFAQFPGFFDAVFVSLSHRMMVFNKNTPHTR